MISGLSKHIRGLEHVGYVVPDLKGAIENCTRLYGLSAEDVNVVPPFDQTAEIVRFAFIRVASGIEFEFIEPVSDESIAQLTGFQSGAAGINHLAYRVVDIDSVQADLFSQGIRPGYVTPDGVVNTGRSKILYLNPEDTGGALIELVEKIHDNS